MQVRARIKFVDVGADLQAAIDSLPAAGGIIQLAPGYYDITTPLLFPTDRPCVLRGAGPTEYGWGYGTIIHDLATNRDTDSLHLRFANQGVYDLAIVKNSTSGATGGVGIRVGYTASVLRHIFIENVHVISAGGYGILFEGAETNNDGRLTILSKVTNCNVQRGQAGGGVSVETGCTTIDFHGCSFDTNAGTNILLYATDNVTFDNCISEDAGSNHVILAGGFSGSNRATVFRECYFEESTTASTHFITGNASTIQNLAVRDCIFVRANAGIQFVKAVKVADAVVCYGLVVDNAQGSAAADSTGYVGTDCISIGNATVGAVVRGGIVETGAHAHYYKLVVANSGTGTLVYQPTMATTGMSAGHLVGRHTIPRATKAQLVACAGTPYTDCIAFNTTDNELAFCDGTSWYNIVGKGAALS